jgi:DNA/RNA-binding domain of Phe-tRNA-synthetase-like protein
MSPVTFTLAPDLEAVVRPGVLWLEGATVAEHEPRLDAPLAATESELRIEGRGARLQPDIDAVRAMYKKVGIDPTRRRPSSEALLRRVLRGDPLPRVNSVVDVCNWCSVECQLPYGLYDAERIEGDVVLRLGREGESYPGIRKDDVNVAGRIALADARGAFGNPTSDSARTMVTTATTRVLLIVFGPRATTPDRLARVLDVTAERMREYAGAVESSRHVRL